MSVYRSGLRERGAWWHALGGHHCVQVPPPDGWEDDPESFPETPGLWRCQDCHVILTTWMLKEGFYPRPCVGRIAALEGAST